MDAHKWSSIFPSITTCCTGRYYCVLCEDNRKCNFIDQELSPGHFCDECRIHVCRADVVLRMAGFSRPTTNQS